MKILKFPVDTTVHLMRLIKIIKLQGLKLSLVNKLGQKVFLGLYGQTTLKLKLAKETLTTMQIYGKNLSKATYLANQNFFRKKSMFLDHLIQVGMQD